MPAAVLLWDFGDTLCDERWMRRSPIGCDNWTEAWAAVMSRYAERWNTGQLSSGDVAGAAAGAAGLTVDEVEAHMRSCCTAIEFFPTSWRIARERRRPQALVTVNPSVFVDWIVPQYGLDKVFDTIVVSGSEGTAEKADLCDVALERLGHRRRDDALLIDNRADLVESWRGRGGLAYHYRDDTVFEQEFDALL